MTASARIPTRSGPGARRSPYGWWIALAVLGAVLGAASVAGYVVQTVVPLFTFASYSTPAAITEHLSAGTYYVFESELQGPPRVGVAQVDVTTSSGRHLAVFTADQSQSRSKDEESFRNVVGFVVSAPGTYTVHVSDVDGTSVTVSVGASIGAALREHLGWVGLAAVGAVMFLLGVVMTIVSLSRRASAPARRAAVPQCTNGHPLHGSDRYCAACGAPARGAPPSVVSR